MNNKTKEKTVIRSELNIEKWPLFKTSTYKAKSCEIVRTIKRPDGDIKQKVVIGKINDVEVGVFRIFDFKGFCALIKIWEEQGRPVNKNIYFSVHKIADTLGLSWGGKTYKEIKAMMIRLRKIPIDWVNSFYNRESKETESLIESFNILSDLKIYEKSRKGGQLALALSSFSFDKRLLVNLINNYSKPLLLDNILKFKKETTILLYRYLDLVMADKKHFERNSKELLGELDLSQEGYPYPAQRKKLLEPVLEELQGMELSTGRIRKAVLVRNKKGKDYKVVIDKEVVKVINAKVEVKELPLAEKAVNQEERIDNVEELINRGINKEVAKGLVQKYPTILINEKIEIFDLLMAGKSHLVSKNPPGWLRKAIENNYIAPTDLETTEKKMEREEHQKALKSKNEERFKIDRYQNWVNSNDDAKIWWDMQKWKKEIQEEKGKMPTTEEETAKRKQLIEKLPTKQEMQIELFGKIIFPEDIEEKEQVKKD